MGSQESKPAEGDTKADSDANHIDNKRSEHEGWASLKDKPRG